MEGVYKSTESLSESWVKTRFQLFLQIQFWQSASLFDKDTPFMTQEKQSVISDHLRLARLRFFVAHEGLWDPLRKQKENLENQRTFTSSVTKYHKKIAKV